jgi:hypothetical protein
MGERMELVVGPGIIDMERNRDSQRDINDLGKIGKLYDLAFAIATKTCLADLGVFAWGNGAVFMPDNQVMQKKLGGDAERKDQQHYSA